MAPDEQDVAQRDREADRTGRGSPAGQLHLADDWDSPAVNDAIARALGVAALDPAQPPVSRSIASE